ncbi:glycosyltransferase [Catenovulum sp. SM1970]|uniref:glycosyltransferase n=1 Tax=Marinifaba aquimaris TaxID=2741323 RepID=UPI0015719910|nr:glycosyltransferase [Marinifaba aquimaris]NTS76923.1 glycosyltransferase [Marinifaba aquimaris]
MKILHLGKFCPTFMGGIENFMFDLIKTQQAMADEVSAIVHHHDTNKVTCFEQNKRGLLCRVKSFGQFAYAPLSPSFGLNLVKMVEQVKPDVIHIHMPNLSAFWCLLYPSIKKIPWVIHWHADVIGSVPDFKIKMLYPFYSVFEKALLARANAVIATSQTYMESSRPLENFREKTKIIPLGITDDQCSNRSHRFSSDKDNILKLLMVGRLTYYKGHKYLIEAVSELIAKGFVLELNIVGTGDLEVDIKKQINNLNLESSVHLLGKLSNEELGQTLSDANLVCLPSIERTEAFGVVLMEAARASKACLVTDVEGSGMSWVIQDGETGSVAKANSVNALVEKLEIYLKTPELLQEHGCAARKRFDETFKINRVAEKTKLLYEQILS